MCLGFYKRLSVRHSVPDIDSFVCVNKINMKLRCEAQARLSIYTSLLELGAY